MCELVHNRLAASAYGKRPRPHGDTWRPGQVKQSGSTLIFGPSYSASRRAEHFLLTSAVNYWWRVIFWTRPARSTFKGQRPRQGQCDTQRPADQAITSISGREVQAIFCRRRHRPRRPPSSPESSPAPAILASQLTLLPYLLRYPYNI